MAGDECAEELTRLRAWLREIGAGEAVAALEDSGEARLMLHPLALAPSPAITRLDRGSTAAQIDLHVLLTAVGGDAEARACLVADVALHVVASGRWTWRTEVHEASMWAALGLTPRPALTVELPVRRNAAAPPAPPVLEPLRVGPAPIRELRGRVVAANGAPVAGALVTLEPTGPTLTTDHRGRFHGVSGAPSPVRATVHARGLQQSLTLSVADDGELGDLVLADLAATPSATPQEV